MPKKQQAAKPGFNLFQVVDNFFEKRLPVFFALSMLLTIIFCAYLFEMRISEGGDDSGYIEYAKRFMDGVAYPSFHGPFYSIFLSWVMRIFGFKVFVFKLTSTLFVLGHLAFFYYTFRGRVSATVLVLAMLLTSVAAELLYYSSHTYTEAMYIFLQSALFFMIIRYFNEIEDKLTLIYRHWWAVLLTGMLMFMMSTTRNLVISVLGVVLLYLLTEKKFYLAGYTFISFLVFRIPFGIYKSLRWNVHGEDISTAFNALLQKNYYNAALGKEDFGGMVNRFLENSQVYLSRLLMSGVGLKDPANTDTSALVTIIIYILFGLALYFAIKKSRVMRFTAYYLGITLFVTFVILQTNWGQMRLVIIYMPLIFILLPWGLLQLAQTINIRWLQPLIVLLLVVMFFRLFGISVNKAKANNEVLMKNLRGNKYYGYTPDWINYLKMSAWAAENVPEESRIAARKPSMSFIYGEGRSFYGIYKFPTVNTDTAFARLEEKSGEPVIINEAELRALKLPMQFEYSMKREVEAFITGGDTMYSVYYFSDKTRPAYTETLKSNGLNYGTDLDFLRDKIAASGKPSMTVVPDTLINQLLRNNVDYIIRGNLRINPAQKTNRVINTVYRYIYYMEQKYYGLFSQVSQIGEKDEEPAYLYKIHWDRYGLDNP